LTLKSAVTPSRIGGALGNQQELTSIDIQAALDRLRDDVIVTPCGRTCSSRDLDYGTNNSKATP
jgi:hypothetical protein